MRLSQPQRATEQVREVEPHPASRNGERASSADALPDNSTPHGVILNSLTYPLYVIDVADHHVWPANRAAHEACRDGAATCHVMTHRQDVPCNTPGHPCPIEIIEQTGSPAVVEHLEQDATGAVRSIEVHAFPIFDEGGTLRQVAELYLDITEHRQAEALQQHFRALFESAPGAYLVLKPEDYEIVAVSDAYLHATMTTRAGIMGKRLFEVFPDDPHDQTPTGVRNLWASLERVKTSRRDDVMAVQYYPIRRPAEQGGVFEERWWSPINTPVFGPKGELLYIIHRVEDVTSYVKARQQEGEVAEGIQTLDTRTHALAAEIMLRGQALQRANEALRKSEERLAAANRELNDFATVVSHDLRSPLRAVATLAQWLQSDYADKLDEKGREDLGEMVHRVRHMDRMIEDILQYSRLGRTEEKREAVALDSLVAEVVHDLDVPPSVRMHITEGLPMVQGDPVRLRQVFQNLIGNAIQHTDKPQTDIRVDFADKGAAWEFRVVDNGPGIEERHFERIFKLFETMASKGKTESTGVGLALAKRIVERAGGRIGVQSRVGAGSTFWFTWPKATPTNEPTERNTV